jgi:hypothetical protein
MTVLTATRQRQEGHEAAPRPELAPLTHYLTRMGARAGFDPGGMTTALSGPQRRLGDVVNRRPRRAASVGARGSTAQGPAGRANLVS